MKSIVLHTAALRKTKHGSIFADAGETLEVGSEISLEDAKAKVAIGAASVGEAGPTKKAASTKVKPKPSPAKARASSAPASARAAAEPDKASDQKDA